MSNKRTYDEALVNNLSRSFVPKKKITHHHGKIVVLVYPDITNDMPDAERTYAFNINKAAVTNEASLSYPSKLAIMGEKHNCTNLIDIELGQWKDIGFHQLKDPSYLSVISYHSSTGATINNCLAQNGALKPIQGTMDERARKTIQG